MKRITLHGGPANLLQVPDEGQTQIVCTSYPGGWIVQSIYETFPERPWEAFFLENEVVRLPEPRKPA